MSKEFMSDKVYEMYGGDPRVVASLAPGELKAAQDEAKAQVPGTLDVVNLPSNRPFMPRVDGLGLNTNRLYE